MGEKRKQRLKPADTYGWARANKISQPYVNQVLNGRRLPGKKITKAPSMGERG